MLYTFNMQRGADKRMTKAQMRNAKKLIRLLENIPNRNFNMRFWFSSKDAWIDTDHAASNLKKWLSDKMGGNKRGCGTAACVGGWAAVLWPDLLEYIPVDEKLSDKIGISSSRCNVLLGSGFEMTAKQKAQQLRKMVGLEGYRPKPLFAPRD